jgi:hypothetical protein
MNGYATYLSRNRALIAAQTGGVEANCARCRWYEECRVLAPNNPVKCELSDEDAQLSSADNQRMRDMMASDDNLDYYWQVRLHLPGNGRGCE